MVFTPLSLIVTNYYLPHMKVCVPRVSIHLELLSKHHLKPLLNFELENRSWLESLIEPRDDTFYSEKGVCEHIDAELDKVSSGSAFCGLLIKNNEIVARANLRGICANKAVVGYRVSKDFTSRGYASFCLTSLVKIAKKEFDIKSLEAKVLENNPVSKHILLKHGFEIIGSLPDFLTLNDKQLTCIEFRLKYV